MSIAPSLRSACLVSRCLIGCLLAVAGTAWAVDVSMPVDVPDDIGLGERLALVSWLGDHKVPVADARDLPALRLAYLQHAHPEKVAAPDAATMEEERQRGELAAVLYRKYGINPPANATAEAIAALIARKDAEANDSIARDQAKASAPDVARAGAPPAATLRTGDAPVAPGNAPSPLPQPPRAAQPGNDANAARTAVGIIIGKPFPEISGKTLDGSAFTLSQWRGKVVLIDFWATWCGPCRAEMPNVKALYQAQHDHGFEVLGVSLDTDKAMLQKMMPIMGIIWPQMFDGQGWDNALAKACAVRAIPMTFLIGKDGVLIAIGQRGEGLAALVTKALGQ